MTTPRGLHALLSGAIDYAGLFPPATLEMSDAIANYAEYRKGDHAWILGRFVVPVGKLAAFAAAATNTLPRGAAPPWKLCAVAGAGAAHELSEVEMFNRRHDGRSISGRAAVEMIEVKVSTAHDVRALDDAIPLGVRMVCEVVASSNSLMPTLQTIRDMDGAAKIRTGGPTADAVPTSEQVADFLIACHTARVPFKATAGLHHAVSGDHPTEDGGEVVHQHGFLNLLMAAALTSDRPRPVDTRMRAQIIRLLDETDPTTFTFTDEDVCWHEVKVPVAVVAKSREHFGLSFGSCSFDEPLADLRAMHLID